MVDDASSSADRPLLDGYLPMRTNARKKNPSIKSEYEMNQEYVLYEHTSHAFEHGAYFAMNEN